MGVQKIMTPADREQDSPSAQERAGDDWELIRRIGAGEQAALEQLYRQYYGMLYRFILQITRRTDYVEEVINDVMFVVWEKAAAVVPLSKASTWVFGIAHKKALQALRRGAKSGEVAVEGQSEVEESSMEEFGIGELETEQVLFALLRALSPEQRAVLELVYYHGMHYAEIAHVIDCPESTVKTRVFHARRKLRAIWPGLTGSQLLDPR